jgi:hypothetical protein
VKESQRHVLCVATKCRCGLSLQSNLLCLFCFYLGESCRFSELAFQFRNDLLLLQATLLRFMIPALSATQVITAMSVHAHENDARVCARACVCALVWVVVCGRAPRGVNCDRVSLRAQKFRFAQNKRRTDRVHCLSQQALAAEIGLHCIASSER